MQTPYSVSQVKTDLTSTSSIPASWMFLAKISLISSPAAIISSLVSGFLTSWTAVLPKILSYKDSAIASFFYKEKRVINSDKKRKILVLIPAYKEDIVIVDVARDALNQDYPRELYDVYVIADQLKKETIEKESPEQAEEADEETSEVNWMKTGAIVVAINIILIAAGFFLYKLLKKRSAEKQTQLLDRLSWL